MFEGGEMVYEKMETDAYGHAKLGGIGDLVRGGDPDSIDSIVPMAFGNLALDLILKGIDGRLVVLKNGRYDNVPLDVITFTKKLVNVSQFYETERYRPRYENFELKPLFIMTSEL